MWYVCHRWKSLKYAPYHNRILSSFSQIAAMQSSSQQSIWPKCIFPNLYLPFVVCASQWEKLWHAEKYRIQIASCAHWRLCDCMRLHVCRTPCTPSKCRNLITNVSNEEAYNQISWVFVANNVVECVCVCVAWASNQIAVLEIQLS